MITFLASLWCLFVIGVSFKYGSHERAMAARPAIKRFDARFRRDAAVCRLTADALEQYFAQPDE